MLKKVIFWFRCIGIVWKDRNNKACRQKYRRMAREFEKVIIDKWRMI
jgi:hypothetical protein